MFNFSAYKMKKKWGGDEKRKRREKKTYPKISEIKDKNSLVLGNKF